MTAEVDELVNRVDRQAEVAGMTYEGQPLQLPKSLQQNLRRTCSRCCTTHLLEDGTDIRVIQVLLGHAKLDNTAFYTRVATRTVRTVTSPLNKLGLFKVGEISPDG